MKIIVYCPWPYSTISGGIMALHKLADVLFQANIDSYIVTEKKNENYGGVVILPNEFHEVLLEDAIVVYPEVVQGNPLNAKNVVRWCLNTPGKLGGDERTYGADDRYFIYDKMYANVAHPERIKGRLFTLEPHLEIFKNENKERFGFCHLIRKGNKKTPDKHPAGSTCIDELNGDFEAMARVFNSRHTFICYDAQCFTATLAALCGCLVIVVPDDNLSAEHFYADLPCNKYGISYGFEDTDIAHATDTLHLVKGQVEAMCNESLATVNNFVAYCKNWIS